MGGGWILGTAEGMTKAPGRRTFSVPRMRNPDGEAWKLKLGLKWTSRRKPFLWFTSKSAFSFALRVGCK